MIKFVSMAVSSSRGKRAHQEPSRKLVMFYKVERKKTKQQKKTEDTRERNRVLLYCHILQSGASVWIYIYRGNGRRV